MYRTIFSYYGGKGIISSKYPNPIKNIIIEPFAGGAAYSLKHYKKQIILYDINVQTCEMWEFILSEDAPYHIKKIPKKVTAGDKIDSICNSIKVPVGLKLIMQASCNVGTAGINRNYQTITKIAAKHWGKSIDKLFFWWPKIRHWKIINNNYTSIKNKSATWFIDPPYNNSAGNIYKHCNIDYMSLGLWCKNRQGQCIVCENYGASWLPFSPMMVNNYGIRSKLKKTKNKEVIYTQIL